MFLKTQYLHWQKRIHRGLKLEIFLNFSGHRHLRVIWMFLEGVDLRGSPGYGAPELFEASENKYNQLRLVISW